MNGFTALTFLYDRLIAPLLERLQAKRKKQAPGRSDLRSKTQLTTQPDWGESSDEVL